MASMKMRKSPMTMAANMSGGFLMAVASESARAAPHLACQTGPRIGGAE
jgi:hypothetical protein